MSKVEVLRVSNRIFKEIGIGNITGFKIYDLGFDVSGYHSFEYDNMGKWVNHVSKIVKVMDDMKIYSHSERKNHSSYNETIVW